MISSWVDIVYFSLPNTTLYSFHFVTGFKGTTYPYAQETVNPNYFLIMKR